jgi:plastocyanin
LNSDPVLHNIHFYQNDESLFNIAQPVQGQVTKKKIEKTGFVYAECDVHGWMQGHLAVVDSPYYAVTDENGKFSITDLPAGTYHVKVWHEYLGEKSQDITVAAKGDASLNLDLKDLVAQKTPAPITSAAPSGGAPAAAPAAGGGPATSGEVVVQMQSEATSYRFEPANITIKVGTTVKWVNASTNRHTATDDPEMEKLAGQAILPAGVMPWDSPFLAEGQSFMKTFTVPGKYQYFCRNHGQFGMMATITVTP